MNLIKKIRVVDKVKILNYVPLVHKFRISLTTLSLDFKPRPTKSEG